MRKAVSIIVGGTIGFLLTSSTTLADPVWHCSRHQMNEAGTEDVSSTDYSFSIASLGSSTDVIGISVSDLIDIYSGSKVDVGGLPLSACFISGTDKLSTSALESLGLKSQTIQALARKSAIVQNNLFYVTDEKQMLSCIAKNFPAVGYLSQPNETDKVLPCF